MIHIKNIFLKRTEPVYWDRIDLNKGRFIFMENDIRGMLPESVREAFDSIVEQRVLGAP